MAGTMAAAESIIDGDDDYDSDHLFVILVLS